MYDSRDFEDVITQTEILGIVVFIMTSGMECIDALSRPRPHLNMVSNSFL